EVKLTPFNFGKPVSQLSMASHVGRKQNASRIGETHRRLFRHALDPGTHRHETFCVTAFAAGFGRAHLMTAMVTHEDATETMLDHPGRAIRALILMATG